MKNVNADPTEESIIEFLKKEPEHWFTSLKIATAIGVKPRKFHRLVMRLHMLSLNNIIDARIVRGDVQYRHNEHTKRSNQHAIQKEETEENGR